jgi:hypothetical protein
VSSPPQDVLQRLDVLLVVRARGAALEGDQIGDRRHPYGGGCERHHLRPGPEIVEGDHVLREAIGQ